MSSGVESNHSKYQEEAEDNIIIYVKEISFQNNN
jgi:hypothetical protein